MDEEKKQDYARYTEKLRFDVENRYSELNIIRIARAIVGGIKRKV